MTVTRRALFIAIAVCCGADARGQVNQRQPHIGYLYPAGGQRSSVVRIAVGGQYLRGTTDVYVSGEGVHASVIQHYPPLRNLNADQRRELVRRMRELIEKRWAELAKAGRVDATPPWNELGLGRPGRLRARKQDSAAKPETVKLPDHPLLNGLEDKTLRELLHVRNALFNFRKRQPNSQIAETVLIEVTIDRGAAPGDRELRLRSRLGLTNPMLFQVGVLPETSELESNDPKPFDPLPKEPPLELPILVNGQVMPGDVDRFSFRARQGQQLVFQTHARRLIPFLADAVPGWFQATLALYDANGNELAFADDYRFDPDPVLFYEIPADGEYELEIRDAIYRGREDFVYRLIIGEQPFITSMFPLGSRTGHKRYAAVDGWNLSTEQLLLDARSDAAGIRQKSLGKGKRSSNQVTYAVDTLRADPEAEVNDTAADAQRLILPRIVNGRIERAGDVDIFQFNGKSGAEVVAEVVARRLHSPVDSVLRLTDTSGRVLAWNDDYEHKDGYLHTDMGVLTHHADSYLRVQLPEDGVYYIQLTDALGHGGAAYAYRLRVSAARPDFALRVTPSSVNVPAGRSAPLSVYALRKDGFDGEIRLVLKDAPTGFRLDGARIPAGRERVRMTLTAPRRGLDEPVSLKLEGRAVAGGQTVSRAAVPAEDMMQAFLYRHLTPSQELMVAVTGGRRFRRPIELAVNGPVQIPVGGATEVRIRIPRNPRMREIELELDEPPEGMTIRNATVVPEGLAFELKAAGDALPVGFADNLIVEAFMEIVARTKEGQTVQQKRRVSLGVLPAIPFEIVPG